MRVLVVAAVSCLAMVGCSGSSHTLTGRVTTLSPAFCVGANAAAGNCFNVTTEAVINLSVGDCVKVSYLQTDTSLRPTAQKVTKVPDSSSPNCQP